MSDASIYLDHNASTPLAPEIATLMRPWLENHGANPSSSHAPGRAARHAIDRARTQLAKAVGCSDDEIVFTSGGTESNNLALFGALLGAKPGARLLTCAAEHSSILEPVKRLGALGIAVDLAPVDREGRVDPDDFLARLRPETKLVSLMLANNEVGTIQPVAKIARLLPEEVLFHCDAVQAFGKIPFSFGELGVCMLSLSAHKIYGPAGAGALIVRKGTPLQGQILGGGQERELRAGTENVAAIVGFAEAAARARGSLTRYAQEVGALAQRFRQEVAQKFPRAIFNSPQKEVLPNTVNVSFPGIDGRNVLMRLDLEGIAVSLGSACASGSILPSHVLEAMGRNREQSLGALRFSFGWKNSEAEVRRVVAKLVEILSVRKEGG